jgi:5'-3' exonuclease
LFAQFHPLEEALEAMGVAVWPMVEYEADDALAAAAFLAAKSKSVEKVCIWTPDKDLAQCVVGDRVVQIDRRKNEIRNEAAIVVKFGVAPRFIPDYLALVGDSADGYPGIKGLGARTAATLINRHGHIEDFPADVLSATNRELALLFKDLATLRTDIPLFKRVDELKWRGPTPSFEATTRKIDAPRLMSRVAKLTETD